VDSSLLLDFTSQGPIFLSKGLSDGNFKFFTSVVDTIAWPLMICWYGDYLSEQVSFAQ
jgi:hypothetical protein